MTTNSLPVVVESLRALVLAGDDAHVAAPAASAAERVSSEVPRLRLASPLLPPPAPPSLSEAEAAELEALRDNVRELQRAVAELSSAATPSEHAAATPASPPAEQSLTLLVLDGDLAKLVATMRLANATARAGRDVHLFVAASAVPWLHRRNARPGRPGRATPPAALGWPLRWLFRLELFGLGPRLAARRLRKAQRSEWAALLAEAGAAGVQLRVCRETLERIGWSQAELLDHPWLDTYEHHELAEQTARAGARATS